MNEANGLTSPSEIELRVLGELDGVRSGAVIDLGGRRQRAALAALVIARGDVVSDERLAECVWGDGAARAAPVARCSPTSAICGGAAARCRSAQPHRRDQPGRSRLRPVARAALDVDAWRFERDARGGRRPAGVGAGPASWRAALDLWRGPAYAEYADEPWAATEVARLAELRAIARERLLDARLALGECRAAGPRAGGAGRPRTRCARSAGGCWCSRCTAAHRQGDALAALRRARRTLADELGRRARPGAARAGARGAGPVTGPGRAGPDAAGAGQHDGEPRVERGPGAAPITGPFPSRRAGLADRAGRSRARAERAWPGPSRPARRARAASLLIEGSAGIGKTRLLAEAGRLRHRGRGAGAVAPGAASWSGRSASATVRQLFEPSLVDPAARDALLAGAAAGARGGVRRRSATTLRPTGSFAVLHGLYWLTVNLAADGPLLLAVDDVQWCDRASLRFLAYLVKRLEGLPVLVVMTVRTGEPAAPPTSCSHELILEPSATVLRPQALSVEAAGAVVRSRLARPTTPS